ncbi:MAG TPA: potassium-transporting ATPase subunit KdpC [Gemmatimonadales bacterium]|jgi:K+-transporting ATPase ATPase C chain|nr:potassium-transporting ATPase subunit KdpC [Gemmatimonadales bacterium]
MRTLVWPSVAAMLVFTFLTGAVYPAAITVVAQLAFPRQAGGSLIVRDGKEIGSSLLGQYTEDPKYFWGRLSATSPVPDNAASSSGSNLGPSNPALHDAVKARVAALKAIDSSNAVPVPIDLATASGSGLDPHISPAAAEYQLARVAKARGLDTGRLRALVLAHTEGRQLGILGEPRVSVLELNLALDQLGGSR